MRGRERAFVALFALAVAGALVADRLMPDARPSAAQRDPVPAAASASYCPLPNADEAKAFLDTANLGSDTAKLRRFAIGEAKASEAQAAEVRPRSLGSVEMASGGIREAAGVVESFVSPTATEARVLARGAGAATASCTDQPGTRWFFSEGSTLRGRDTYLLILNPFEEEASVGVRLLTPEGPVPLPRLREYSVRPRTEAVIFLSDYHPEDESFGIDVKVSRGRLIVGRYIRLGPRDGARGLSLSLGAQQPAARWVFAAGEVPGEGEEVIAVANPGEREALVQVLFQTEADQVAPQELEEVPVPPGGQVTVKVSDRLARGTSHGTTVLSTNGVRVVAERQTRGDSGAIRGLEAVPGVARDARRWLVPVGTPAGGNAQLALVNTGREEASVAVRLLTPEGEVRPPELARIAVGAGRRTGVDLTPFLGGKPATAVVEASADGVVAEGRASVGDPYLDFADAPARPAS